MKKLTVVISQSQGKDPRKRDLEENILAALVGQPDVAVSVVPHLYDLSEDHTGTLFLRSITGPLLVLGWLYPRGIHWTLDRLGIKGQIGQTQLKRATDEDEEAEDKNDGGKDDKPRLGAANAPARTLWSLDLQDGDTAETLLAEILRIAGQVKVAAKLGLMETTDVSFIQPPIQSPKPEIQKSPTRRWYPVIDYSRCTNCMECIDFCLFGVYGVDDAGRILAESEDNCRKGCPACSRVCPENAIIFPMHRTPALAGAPGAKPGDLKLDLSQLFGAPSALELAAKERDTELVKDGRDAVGVAKRQPCCDLRPKDALDKLMDALDGEKL